jgi:hypothetical protein
MNKNESDKEDEEKSDNDNDCESPINEDICSYFGCGRIETDMNTFIYCESCKLYYCKDHDDRKCSSCGIYLCSKCDGISHLSETCFPGCWHCFDYNICDTCIDRLQCVTLKESAIQYVKEDGHYFEYLNESFRNDYDVVLESVKNSACSYIYSSYTLKFNWKILYTLIQTLYSTYAKKYNYSTGETDTVDFIPIVIDILREIPEKLGLSKYIYNKSSNKLTSTLILPYLRARIGVDIDFVQFVHFDISFIYDDRTHKRKNFDNKMF